MGSSCPQFATRWLDMGHYCEWHLANVAAINKHFDGSHGSNPPLPWYFWPLIAVVHKIIKEFEKAVKVLQGQTVTLSDQELQMEALIATLMRETGLVHIPLPAISPPILPAAPPTILPAAPPAILPAAPPAILPAALPTILPAAPPAILPAAPPAIGRVLSNTPLTLVCSPAVISGSYLIMPEEAEHFIRRCSNFAKSTFDKLSQEEKSTLVTAVSHYIVSMADGIDAINVANKLDPGDKGFHKAVANLSSLLPGSLCKLSALEFEQKFEPFIVRREVGMENRLQQLLDEVGKLNAEYRHSGIAGIYDSSNGPQATTFEGAWADPLKKKYPTLHSWAGTMSTIFPNTATVEADFSFLGWLKDVFRMALTDLSLEGSMHSKEYERLSALSDKLSLLPNS